MRSNQASTSVTTSTQPGNSDSHGTTSVATNAGSLPGLIATTSLLPQLPSPPIHMQLQHKRRQSGIWSPACHHRPSPARQQPQGVPLHHEHLLLEGRQSHRHCQEHLVQSAPRPRKLFLETTEIHALLQDLLQETGWGITQKGAGGSHRAHKGPGSSPTQPSLPWGSAIRISFFHFIHNCIKEGHWIQNKKSASGDSTKNPTQTQGDNGRVAHVPNQVQWIEKCD